MSFKCKECDKEFETEKGLHGHFRKHKISMEEYYQKHFPRFDLYSHSPIHFKSLSQYMDTDFNSAANFKKWCYKAEKQEAREYLAEKMKLKMKEKGSLFVMGDVQLQSYGWPSVEDIESVFGSFDEFCRAVEAPAQFGSDMPKKFLDDCSKMEVWVDTREQKPLNLANPTKAIKLDCGDYTMGGEHFNHTFVDRKSAADFIGTMSKGLERFKQEMERCASLGAYMFIVVDASMSGVARELAFNKNTRVNIHHIWHNMREIMNEFCGDCQFVFCEGRAQSALIVPKILSCGKDIWKVDVQHYLNSNGEWME